MCLHWLARARTKIKWHPPSSSSVKSGSKPGISSHLTGVTKKMNALLGIVSINLSLLASPNLTEEGSAAFVKCPSNKITEENCVNWLQEAIRFVTVFNE